MDGRAGNSRVEGGFARSALLSFAALAAAILLAPTNAVALQPLAGATKIVGGITHTCVLTTAGGLKCWGLNNNGELGENSTAARFTPVDVSGLTSGVTAAAAGDTHTCAVTTGTGVKCWGRNSAGQLGDGTTTQRLAPVDVSGLASGVMAVAAGGSHTCALTTTGGVKCWGYNFYGQLGDGTTTQRTTPVDVPSLTGGVIAIAAGNSHTCALTSVGGVKCWGLNSDGELGDGTQTNSLVPVDASGLASGVATIATGPYHTCAVTTGGGAKCWGFNTFGQLGDGTLTQRLTPVDVAGLTSGVATVAPSQYHTCAVTTAGGVKCWGYNPYGELGDNTTTGSQTPVDVTGLSSGVAAATAGLNFSCALGTGGGVKCWGQVGIGYLGIGIDTREPLPADVVGLASGVTAIAAGDDHTCAVMTGGGVKCWGRNDRGYLGDNSNLHRATPVDVSGLSGPVTEVSPGTVHTCALTSTGGAQCWGRNNNGQLGNGFIVGGPGIWTPIDVSGMTSGVAAIASGVDHTCALTTGGGVKCWGQNNNGQLGDGTQTQRATAADVPGLTSGVSAIAVGDFYSCALTTGGGVKCWGANGSGQLGDGSTTYRLVPTDVSGLASGVTAITAGELHACALTTAGGVKCWGWNSTGQLGDTTLTRRLTPVDVSGLASGVISVKAGDSHTCALTTGGGMKCWGYNGANRLGDGANLDRRAPVDVIGLGSGVAAIAVGGSHVCALTTGGGAKCWGYNGYGQVGNTTDLSRPLPVDVLALDTDISREISTAKSHSLALDATGKVYAWGSDSHGQLGQARAVNRTTPAVVPGLPALSHISLAQHALAVDANKQVWSWGENACGQLGPRDAVIATTPSRVLGAKNMTRVAAGGCFSLALGADGSVWGWGLVPGYGASTEPRQLAGLAGITEIAAGTSHALALAGGTVYVLGDNAQGQLGLGATGTAQAAVQVPGLAGVTAIAAGDLTSMVIAGGQPYFWGRHADGTQVTSPLALAGLGSTAASISVTGNRPYAARGGDGAVLAYSAIGASWVTDITGFAGIAKVVAGNKGFLLGIDGVGQVFAGGSNTAGQLGQANTTSSTGAVAVTGMSTTTMVAAGALYPSVLALKADGTLWFWGADTLGESGDGGQVTSSVPRLVALPATIRQVATGDRYSVALDTNGDTWSWGDNGSSALSNSLVNRSTPARGPVRNVQAVAAGGPGLVVYLLTDGTVRKAGAQAYVGLSVDPIFVPGLANITGIAAGEDTAYALRGDGVVLAFGAGASGELGNGTTTFSAAAVPVQGITGTVVKISAARFRAGAVTGDGKVWTWGAAPLGNGSSGGSLTAVQVPGITDAVDISVGTSGTIVRRSNGSLLAWGDLGLDDAAGQDTLLPYAVAFHEPVQSAHAGRGSYLGFIVGNGGLAWGFGRYGTISTLNAAIGDGTFVRRSRPVVLLAAGGSGNIDTNDWYLDLDTASAETVPAASTPKMLGVSQLYGSGSGLAFDATIKYKAADLGKPVNNYVFGLVPTTFFGLVESSPKVSPAAKLAAKAAKAEGFVLAQLTPSGWTDVSGQLIAYSQGTANALGGATNILNGIDTTLIAGARFCVGYGEDSGSMLSFQALSEVLLLEGAATNVSGVPCVLTGIYVDGPASSRVGTAAAFKASVVGLSPTGSVQFSDGAASLLAPVTLAISNEAVGTAQVATNGLALGSHSIGASYGGDSQNAAVAAEIPLLHEVVEAPPGGTATSLAGPASSELASPVVFSASVAGDAPTGTVQFKDGGADLGGALALVGGVATLRTGALAAGTHSLTAVYSGDSKNLGSTSLAIPHTVFAAINTAVTLASNASDTTVGGTVTFTVTVTGADPTGNVIFRDGATVIATVPLVNGVASLTVADFSAGQHVITAEYEGDANDQGVTSTAVFQQVSQSNPAFDANVQATVTGYYQTILGRAPDAGGLQFWSDEAKRVVALGADVREVFYSMSIQFFASPEYVNRNNSDTQFLTDMYRTFFLREPDTEGLTFWQGQLTAVGSRSALLNSFLFSTEFSNQMTTLFGASAVRPEVNVTMDLFRGTLGRLPDSAGFSFWLGQVRAAQCGGADAGNLVNAKLGELTNLFFGEAEYVARGRNDRDFMGDIYNTYLRRGPGGDAAGFDFWVGQIASLGRDGVRAQFLPSPEFQSRVAAIVAAGCL